MIYFFLITEVWAITGVVLLYVIWMYTLPHARIGLRIVVPFIISLVAHLLLLATIHHNDIPRCISDIFYDWLTPIGIYHIAAELKRRGKELNG